MVEVLLALFRIPALLRIERLAKLVTSEIDTYDQALNGTPPLYADARSPNGDDYNALLSITEQLRNADHG